MLNILYFCTSLFVFLAPLLLIIVDFLLEAFHIDCLSYFGVSLPAFILKPDSDLQNVIPVLRIVPLFAVVTVKHFPS